MKSTRRFRRAALAAVALSFAVCAAAADARAQLQNGALAVKTNGNLFRAGDSLRVELVALERVYEPFSAEVTYRWTETIRERDEDGEITLKDEERRRTRPRTPVVESIDESQLLLLDDAFHFGEGSAQGRYTIEVALLRAGSKTPATTLRACVYYGEYENDACAIELRGLKRVTGEQQFAFRGAFSGRGRFAALLFRNNKLAARITEGVFASAADELTITSEALAPFVGRTFDLLLHDREHDRSTTITGVAPVLPY